MKLLNMWRIDFCRICVLVSTLNVFCECSGSFDFERVIKELQTQVRDLQKVRQEDSETIQKLHKKVDRYEEMSHLKTSSRLSEESRKSLSHAKDSEIIGFEHELVESEENRDLKSQVAFLRHEISQLRKEVEARKVDVSHVAIEWLQKTVEDLRHEMKEIASSLNTSVALADKQRTESTFELFRSDLTSLGHRMDSVRVDRERNTARIQQLRQDADELRTRLQVLTGEHTKIRIQLESLKEEFRVQNRRNYERKFLMPADHRTKYAKEAWTLTDANTHPKLRHGHWKEEVEKMYAIVHNLERKQSKFGEELKKIQDLSSLKVGLVEKTCYNWLNKSEFDINQRVKILESIINKTEVQTLDIQSRVNNITSSGIEKLHESTLKLFEALEHLESNHDRTTEDIRREMSKLDYNLSQTQSDLGEVRDRQIVTDKIMSTFKNDVTSIQSETRKNHLHLLLVHTSVRNRTLENSYFNSNLTPQEEKISDLESKIETLFHDVDAEKTEMNTLHHQMIEKVDKHQISRWDQIQRKVRESILEFKEDIPEMKKHEEKIEIELEKIQNQLPADCSLNPAFEHSSKFKSGAYLIHPALDLPTVKIYCDMETAGGQWSLIQRRYKGDHSFEQDWKHYKDGFGDVTSGDFWLGNEYVHQMTMSKDYALRIDLWDSQRLYRYAEYSTFRVLNENDNYRLVVGGYRGNASDALSYHNGMPFSTPDRDNDASLATHCSRFYGSGWWYNHCQYVNINGRFNTGITWYHIEGQEWIELTKVEMKIKLRNLVYL